MPRGPSLELTVARMFLGVLITVLLSLGAIAQTLPASAVAGPVAKQVNAILADQCVSCHGPSQKKGGLDLTRRSAALKGGKSGPAIVPGSPDLSLLVDKVAEGEMPPRARWERTRSRRCERGSRPAQAMPASP